MRGREIGNPSSGGKKTRKDRVQTTVGHALRSRTAVTGLVATHSTSVLGDLIFLSALAIIKMPKRRLSGQPLRRWGEGGTESRTPSHPQRSCLLPLGALVLGLTAACGSDPDVVLHPIPDSLSVPPGSAVVVTRDPDSAGSAHLAAFAARLGSRSVLWTVGSLEGPEEELYGDVHQVEWLGPETIAILDRQAGLVRAASRGSPAGVIGGPGQGPGEYEFPVSVLSVDSSEVVVLEGSGGLQRFRMTDGGFEFSGRRRVEGFPQAACILDDGPIVIHVPEYGPSVQLSGVLLLVDHDGNVGLPFALPYRHRNWLVADRMNRGLIACAGEDNVVLAPGGLNGVYAYQAGSSGDLLWHSTFEGIRIPPVRERTLPDGRTSVGINARREPHFHFLRGLAGGNGVPLVVQFGRRKGQDVVNGIDRYGIETYLLDVQTGEGLYLGESLPRVLSLHRDRVVLLHEDPYPRIEVASLPEEVPGSR